MIKKGDFSQLASNYLKYRPSYNKILTKKIIEKISLVPKNIKAVDIGSGTGIFAKCLYDCGLRDIIAIEPNDKMRLAGIESLGDKINFLKGTAEKTNLSHNSFDLISMASSFHWTEINKSLDEFNKLLKKNGIFVALWNPRLTEKSEPENQIQQLLDNKYNLKTRVSSGLSGITENLTEVLEKSSFFKKISYLESVDIIKRSHEEYIGAWLSVNDVQSQLGKTKFKKFIIDVKKIISNYRYVEVHYLTRAWIAFKE